VSKTLNVESFHVTNGPTFRDLVAIREGVCKSLVFWFNNHYRDFSGSKPLEKKLQSFIDDIVVRTPPCKDNFVGYLQKMYLKKNGKGTYTSLFDSGILVDNSSCPEPIVPKTWDGVSFLDLDEREIARQLTIAEHHSYAEIQVRCSMKLSGHGLTVNASRLSCRS
jgi:hypothetical protein